MLTSATLTLALLSAWLAAPSTSLRFQDPPAASAPAKRIDGWRTEISGGMKAMQEKRYADAVPMFVKVMESDAPPQAKRTAAYNLGCAYALTGEKEKAVELVVKAIDLGFYDFDEIRGDEDLKSVRDDARIADAMKRNQAKKDAADAAEKKQMDEMRAKWDEQMKADIPKALEELKKPEGAGFEFKFDLKTLDGKPISTEGLKGKVMIVDIWGTWCPPCRMEIPNFVELAKKHEKDAFAIVGLNDEDRKQNKDAADATAKVESFARKYGIQYPLALIDTPTIKQVPKFEGYPTTLFIDKKGKVRLMEVGYASLEKLDAIVTALLAE
ncbi:MAG: redoxin domain-containing protein [Planctomycetes bacterium]|nr:redoxin domain-containing protein [Planctomycetota bacterium]